MIKQVKMMAIVRKIYNVDTKDSECISKIEADFNDSCVGSLAIHYFPIEDLLDKDEI